MAQNNTLKGAIRSAIKQNGNKEITGELLQQVLLSMVNSLGVGYMYMGMATPATNPGTPDQNVFYFAIEAGTYSNFGGIVLSGEVFSILSWDGTWHNDAVLMDNPFVYGTGTGSARLRNSGSYATGPLSVAEGLSTRALNASEHAEGEYNKSNTGVKKTRHSVGIGTSGNNRRNAHEITSDGDNFIYGIGGYDGTNPGTSKSLQSFLRYGHVVMNNGASYDMSGTAEADAALSKYGGNPHITSMSYWFNGSRGVGTGEIRQSIYRTSGGTNECVQYLFLNGLNYKRVITLGAFNTTTETFPIVTVGAWAQQ